MVGRRRKSIVIDTWQSLSIAPQCPQRYLSGIEARGDVSDAGRQRDEPRAQGMHCMTVSLAQGGEGLGAMWGEEKTREYLQKAGFRSITTHRLAHDIQNNWYVVTK